MKKICKIGKCGFKSAWTFIETLIVMAIVMILTASVGFSSVKQIDRARCVTAKSQIESLSLALENYYLDYGFYPDESQGLSILWQSDSMYISKPLDKDPWGNPYVYRLTGNSNFPYEIISYGKDGLPGGNASDKDISSR